MMLAIVTLICGSSSRGVTMTAKRPSSKAMSPSSGVSWLSRKYAAIRPLMPSFSVMLRGRLASLHARSRGIERDGVSRHQTGEHLDPVVVRAAEAHLAQ